MSGTGRIDLVWGDENFGLKHILDKHETEFKDIGKEISKIVESGKLVSKNGVDTIWHKIDDKIFKLGLGKGFKGQGDNHWILTGYEVTREKDKTFGDALFIDKQPLSNPSTDIIPKNTEQTQALQEATQESLDTNKFIEKIHYDKGRLSDISELLSEPLNDLTTYINRNQDKYYHTALSKQDQTELVSMPYEMAKVYSIWSRENRELLEKEIPKLKRLLKAKYIDEKKIFDLDLFKGFQGETTQWLSVIGFDIKNKNVRKAVIDAINQARNNQKSILEKVKQDIREFISNTKLYREKKPKDINLHSNQHIGTGLVTGTLNGFEADENGNVTLQDL